MALRELYSCGQPINQDVDFDTIGNGLLGLEPVHNLACWEPMTIEHGYIVPTVHQWYGDAIKNGAVWFIRWATDQILKFRLSGNVSDVEWAEHVQDGLKFIMKEIEGLTIETDNRISLNGLKEAEAIRFNDLLSILVECFSYTRRSLEITPNSRIGVDELLRIANESDIVCMRSDINLRLSYAAMREAQNSSSHMLQGRVWTGDRASRSEEALIPS